MKGGQAIQNKKIILLILTAMAVLISVNLAFTAHYEYDALGRLTKVYYSNEQTTKSASYSYDSGRNIVGVTGFQSVTEITTEGTTETETETATETTTSNTAALVWNYSTGENTNNTYTVNANSWSNAVPVTYGSLTLTNAVKMESNSSISFTAPQAGTLKVVSYSTQTTPKIKINNVSYTISTNGMTAITLSPAGTYTITKDTTNTYLYYLSFEYELPKPTYIWNYTNSTNTDNFYTVSSANEWTNATSVSYNGLTLTRAIKMESNTAVSFTAPKAGKLILVTYSTKTTPTVNINNTTQNVSTNGYTEITITAGGTYTITKGTTNTYIYYISFTEN